MSAKAYSMKLTESKNNEQEIRFYERDDWKMGRGTFSDGIGRRICTTGLHIETSEVGTLFLT